jgi:hypothetical protein
MGVVMSQTGKWLPIANGSWSPGMVKQGAYVTHHIELGINSLIFFLSH